MAKVPSGRLRKVKLPALSSRYLINDEDDLDAESPLVSARDDIPLTEQVLPTEEDVDEIPGISEGLSHSDDDEEDGA